MLAEGLAAGDREMNLLINDSQQFGLSDEFTISNLQEIIERYVRLGLITNMDDVDAIMEMAWSPVL